MSASYKGDNIVSRAERAELVLGGSVHTAVFRIVDE